MPKFSVIIPVYSELDPSPGAGQRHYRGKTVQRAIKSIIAQQFPDWELILVDDGCDEGTRKVLHIFADSDERIKVIEQPNQNRAVARNTGMDAATGEWLCWLDSDDEYSTHYLREMDRATIDYPEYNIFNFGSIIHWPDHHTSLRPVFTPAIEGDGHAYFRSGHIGAGSFIFRKDLWMKPGYRMPDEVNPYQFAAASRIPMNFRPDEPDYPFIENPDEAFQDAIYRHGLSLGNPWGDDYCQYFYLTRDNISKSLDVLLYVQYPRSHEEVYEHFGEIYDVE